MISGIGAFSSVSLPGLAQSAQSDGQRSKQGDSGNRGASSFAPILANTDATGLTVSAEQRKMIQELRQRDRDLRGYEQAPGPQETSSRQATAQALRGYAGYGNTAPAEAALVPARLPVQELHVLSTTTQAQTKMERAAAAYKRMGGETGLALLGTGISRAV